MKQLIGMVVVFVALVLLGSSIFAFTEHEPFSEGLYFTLTTLTTVGYGDLVPHTVLGRWAAMALMIVGVSAGLYFVSAVTSFIVEGRLRQLMGIRKMQKTIERMRGHFIVCGYGKLGKVVARTLEAGGGDFVVIEADAQKAGDARERGYAVVEGDASVPDTLTEAGLERAAGVAATMADDAENLYIGITARSVCPQMPIVCRSSSERARMLFRRAGIDTTINTDEMGARRLVASLTRPQITEFIDEITQLVEGRPSLHGVRLEEGAPLVGQSLIGSRLREDFDISIVAIQRGGTFVPNPAGGEILQEGDILILIGTPENVERLRALLQGAA